MHTIEIADKAALRSVLEDIKKRYGTDGKAAKKVGLNSRDTFRHLRVGPDGSSITFDTFAAIFGYLGGDPRLFGRAPWPTEFAAVGDESQLEGLDPKHAARLEARRRRIQIKYPEAAADLQAFLDDRAQEDYELYERFMNSIVVEDIRSVWSNYEAWMKRELRRLRPRADPILRELWDHQDGGRHPYRPLLWTFLKNVARPADQLPPEDDLRCWLAICRAVEPLADHRDTWGIELTWGEMGAAKLKAYLKAALKRETLLLDPPEDLKRVARGKVPWVRLDEETAKDAHVEENGYRYWLRDEVRRLRGEDCWSTFRWIWKQPEYKAVIAEHLEATTGTRNLPDQRKQRQWLALLRAVEPLGVRTGGVERSAAELHRTGELETYLRNALANERTLLDREDATVRLERRRQRDLDWLDEALADAEDDAGAESDEVEGETEPGV